MRTVDFDLGRLLNDASRRFGSDDFGTMDFLQPLGTLLDAFNNEAELTLIGRMAMREEILQSLLIRLRIQADRKRDPEIAAAGIVAPLFITGIPRSGTTFLHNLLAEDPRFRAPAAWEVMYPSPSPGARPSSSDRRIARAQRRMEQLYWLAPEFKVIHPLDAALPQECIAITSSSFVSDSFPTMCHIPSYQRWLDNAQLLSSYQYHRCFLQHLQGGHKDLRWLLKAPAHLFGLRALLDVYPDARLVFTHRDPLEALPSLASLTLALRGAFSDRLEPEQIGHEIIDHWATGMQKARDVVLQLPDRQARCIDISYDDLTGRPLEAVERLYDHFDLALSREARSRMQNYLRQRPKGRFGPHLYSLAEFAIDAKQVEQAFAGLQGYCH